MFGDMLIKPSRNLESIWQLTFISQLIIPLLRTIPNFLISFYWSLAPEMVSTVRLEQKDEFRALLLRWGYVNLTPH